jgi:hypothetical protein
LVQDRLSAVIANPAREVESIGHVQIVAL